VLRIEIVLCLLLPAASLILRPALAGGAVTDPTRAMTSGATALEEVTVSAPELNGVSFGGSAVTQGQIQEFRRDTLDEAVLLAPGTSVSEVGARNETDVWIRGFDRWRVPLYQDGIPIYLPVDDRIDFGRFSTLDLSEIQISKGYASVIDGPGAMGGAINLVTRVVQRPLEADGRVGMTLDSTGSYAGWTSEMFLGARRSDWFVQTDASFLTQSHFRLADDFTPGTLQGSGKRLESAHQDYKVEVKAGYLPSERAQYTINFSDQIGNKGNPPPDGLVAPAELKQAKFWSWPAWDNQMAYFLSRNGVDDRGSYVKTRLYYERFFNKLDSFDSIAYDTQLTPKSFDSTYDDRAAGGSAELDENLPDIPDTLRFSALYRWDQHNETEDTRNAPGAPWYQEPWETATENTSSLAVENRYRPAERWLLTVGASYDHRHLLGDNEWVAQGATPPFGYSFAYPVADKHALNGEAAVIYRYSASGSVHFTYADRARFPTLFEMYSTRFGTFQNNPELQPERSHYAQAGIDDVLLGTRVTASVFYARVDQAIEAVALTPVLSEDENVGAERRYGYELSLRRALLESLSAGVDYSNLTRTVLSGGAVPTDTPDYTVFAFLDWRPLPRLSVRPSVQMQGRRWLQGAVNDLLYYRAGSFARVDLEAAYRPSLHWQIDIGVHNLTDRNILFEDGYHGPGREYFADLRASL
jgi:iron complex outermembrane receptor protein